MSDSKEPWSADDRRLRFTPKTLAIGYLSVFGALLCLVTAALTLLDGDNGTASTVYSVAFGVVAIVWLVSSLIGIMAIKRRARS
jgi:protein-S-isoprenylcysteine O-methyltransferase Ste14